MLNEHYFAVRYGDIVVLLYHEDMPNVCDLLFENSRREKTLKRFLEYCFMLNVKVAFEGLKGEKTRGLKTALKYAKEHDMGMTEEQILVQHFSINYTLCLFIFPPAQGKNTRRSPLRLRFLPCTG